VANNLILRDTGRYRTSYWNRETEKLVSFLM